MTTTSKAGALARAREYLAERAELQRAVCAVCGGIVGAGLGVWDGPPDREHATPDVSRRERMLPPLLGWTRRHTTCDDPVRVVLDVTGLRVPREVARAALASVHPALPVVDGVPASLERPIYASATATPFDVGTGWPGKAWAHLARKDREAFARIVADLQREHRLRHEPHACIDGPCGSCGVRLSLGWFESPLRWKDGAPAPWCRDCYAVARRRPETSDPLRLRAITLEALSGASGIDMAAAFGDEMRMFCELVDAGHPGTAERWEHAADQWAEIREAVRMTYPGSLPAEIREHYRELVHAAREAANVRMRQQRDAERAAENAATGWPTS